MKLADFLIMQCDHIAESYPNSDKANKITRELMTTALRLENGDRQTRQEHKH